MRTILPCVSLAAAAAAAIAGCAGGSALARISGPAISNCTMAIAPASTEIIGLNLTGEAPCNDNTYTTVLGFFGGNTIVTAQVISLTSSPTDLVEFVNLDSSNFHTAANLKPWTGNYPNVNPDSAATPTPAMHDISELNFTTGNISPSSAATNMYVADVPGVYVFGCAYHYVSNNMRTVIIVR